MRKLLALTAVVALVVASADPVSAGWRRCGYRGQYAGQAWNGYNQNGQVYYTNNGGTYTNNAGVQQAPQSVTTGYPPNDSTAPAANTNSAPPPAPPTESAAPAPQPNR